MDAEIDRLGLSARLRKVSLYCFVIFLAISALLAIAAVLSGSYEVFELKILLTTTVIAAASVCGLSCSASAQRTGLLAPAVSGAALACVSALLFIVGAWLEVSSDLYWRLAIVSGIYAIAVAHALALTGLPLRRAHAWLRPLTVALIFVLATVIAAVVWSLFWADWIMNGVWNLIIVLAIVVVLATLVLPILSRLAADEAEPPAAKLQLTRRSDGIYVDPQGRVYRVTALPPDA